VLYFKIILKASYIKQKSKKVKNKPSIGKIVKINDLHSLIRAK
jgi:hypothetical protein